MVVKVSTVYDGTPANSVIASVLVNKNISSTEKVTGTIFVSVMSNMSDLVFVLILVMTEVCSLRQVVKTVV